MTPTRLRRVHAVLDRRQPDLTVLMEDVHKPHNLSAIARTCDSVGIGRVHAVLEASSTFRIWRRGAQGSERWVESVGHRDLASALAALRASGHRVVAADVGPSSVDYRTVDYTGPTALLVGNELDGLSAAARAEAEVRVRIPSAGMAESLNVSVATAIVLFEAYRQREAAGLYRHRRLPPPEYRRLRFEWLHPRVAAHCRRLGVEYPDLGEAGDIRGEVPRGPIPAPAACTTEHRP